MQYECQHNQSKLLSACWLSPCSLLSHSSQLPSARLQWAAIGAHTSSQPSEFSLFQKHEASPVSSAEIVSFIKPKPSPSLPAHHIPAHATKHLPDPHPFSACNIGDVHSSEQMQCCAASSTVPQTPNDGAEHQHIMETFPEPTAPIPAFCMAFHAT